MWGRWVEVSHVSHTVGTYVSSWNVGGVVQGRPGHGRERGQHVPGRLDTTLSKETVVTGLSRTGILASICPRS